MLVRPLQYCCIIFLLLLGIKGYAKNSEYKFKTYRVENGLSQNTVWCSLQDHDGFIWFGTKDGLNRFDGKEFLTFQHDRNDSLSLGNNFIRALYEEEDHNSILVGTDDGLYRLDLKIKPTFNKISLPDPENLRQVAINSICSDKEGNVWIGTFGHGIYVYSKKLNKYKIFKANNKEGSITTNLIWKIFCDSDGIIWVGTLTGGLLRYNPTNDTFENFRSKQGLCNDIYDIYEDKTGRLWIGTWDNGLKCLNREKLTVIDTSIPGNECEAIRCIIEEERNQFLIGCNDGLFHYDAVTEEYYKIPLMGRHPGNIVNDGIYSFLRDSEGGLWIGGYFAGVNYTHPNSNNFDHYNLSTLKNPSSGHIISDIVEEDDNTLWIATEDYGLACFKRDTGDVAFIDHGIIKSNNLHSLMIDGDELWIGNINGDIDILNIRNKGVKHYNIHDGLDVGGIYSIFKNNSGDIYVGGVNGLLTFNKTSDSFERIMEFPVSSYVYDIIEGGNGIIWIATYGDGIFTYNPRSKKWKNYVNNPSDPKSLSSNKIICLNSPDPYTVLIGSEGGGLSIYNIDTDDFTNITKQDGLPNDVVYGIERDNDGFIWVSTNKGLTCYDPGNHIFKTYFYRDGLQSAQFNYKASLALQDGSLCFGGINGINIFNPKEIYPSEYIPPVRITSFYGLTKDGSKSRRHMLPYTGGNNDKLRADIYDSGSIRIEFIALSYMEPLKNQYAYRLSGVDNDWVYCGNENRAIYQNLSPGKYIFEVKGANGDGVWNPEISKLEIEIHPPLYKSSVAYLIYGICILSLIGWIVNISVLKIKRRNQIAKLRFERDKQYEYYEGQLNFFSRMAHEIRTPLSLINAPLEEIENKYPEDADFKEAVDVMKNNTNRLMTLVDQLLDFRKGIQGINLNFTEENISVIVENIYNQMLPYARQKGLSLNIVLPESPVIAGVDKESLNKIVTNLLFNAVKYTKSKIEVKLTTNDKTHSFAISISDDGKGIKDEDKEKIFTLFYRVKTDEVTPERGSGVGLAIVKHCVEAHKGEIKVTNNNPVGTIFTVSLPLTLINEEQSLPMENILIDDSSKLEAEKNEKNLKDDRPTNEKIIISSHAIPRLLIVEDNEDLRNFLVKKFSADYEVMSAENGKIGLGLLEKYEIDLVITDIMMSEMDGLEL